VAAGALWACNKREKPAEEEPRMFIAVFKKEVEVDGVDHPLVIGDDDLDNAQLVVDGEDAGTIQPRHGGPSVVFALPKGKALADRSAKLALRLPTPCGTFLDVPLPDYETNLTSVAHEEKARRDNSFTIEIRRGKTELPESFAIWVDDVGYEKATVKFGSVAVTGPVMPSDKARDVPGRTMQLWGLDCAKTHEVSVDGAAVGVASKLPDTKAFLIATEANVCYRRQVLRYASTHDTTGGGTTDYGLPTGQVVPMPWSGFSYFLRSAPSGIAGDYSTTRSALERVDCAEAAKLPMRKKR
jgi:hypothetical protein